MFVRPQTLAAMMIAPCGSHILGDFKGLSKFEGRERDAIIRGWGNDYAMGSTRALDGMEREGIDEQMFVNTVSLDGQDFLASI